VAEDPKALERLIAAEQDERRRIALSLHDGPVQNLSGIALMLDAALYSLDTGRLDDARGVLSNALERQRETIRELRDLSFALEPVVLRDQGFGAAIQELASQIGQAYEVRVDVESAAAEELGETAQAALYTIVRELLYQAVMRTALSLIDVRMTATGDGGLETTVVDDAEPERRRRSLDALMERVRELRGTLEVVPGGSGGTRVVVSLPPYALRR
jgi:two-component system, NarL family, sensor kinase